MEDGGESLTDSPPPPLEPEQEERTWSDYFDDLCVYYMALGMSYRAFWNGCTNQMHLYERAWKQKRDDENNMLHLQALYLHKTLANYAEVFVHAKDAKILPFDKYPLPLDAKQKEKYDAMREEDKEREARESMIKSLMR